MNAFLPGCRRSGYWLACALPLPLLLLLQQTPGDTIPGGIRPPGQRLEFEGTVPFHAPELEVEWKVPAGSLPKEVSIYRRADGLPSPTTLASLLQFAGLEQARPVTNHAGWVVYQDSAVPGRVQVDAGSGRLQYFDPTREESPGSDTIPGVDELDGLLREWIDRLGLPLSEFKTNTQGRLYKRFQETETTSYDRATGGHVTRVTARGVSGIRQAGGWSMGGRQQISLEYGPDGRLLSLELDWLRLEQVAVEPVAGSRQILEWLRDGLGGGFLIESTPTLHIPVADLVKLTVLEAEPGYEVRHGSSGTLSSGNWMIPYARLQVEGEVKAGERFMFSLVAPLIPSGLPEPRRQRDSILGFPAEWLPPDQLERLFGAPTGSSP